MTPITDADLVKSYPSRLPLSGTIIIHRWLNDETHVLPATHGDYLLVPTADCRPANQVPQYASYTDECNSLINSVILLCMQPRELDIPGIILMTPTRHRDHRGFFSEIFSAPEIARLGINFSFVQENYSFTAQKHTVRGLHAQSPPFAQAKLVQVLAGAVLDVAVDLRRGSPWYGKFVAAELSADNWSQILIPAGFAHGFCTLTPDTAVLYKVTAAYSAAHDGGILWNDPALNIPWPAAVATAVLSDKDRQLPLLADYTSPFVYDGNTA